MSTSFRSPFVGVGTGRCGTNSLTRVITACNHTTVSHEGYQLEWYKVTDELGRMIREFRGIADRGILCGDVSQSTITRIPDLRAAFTDMPVVCIHRDKESTVESFMNYGSPLIRPQDKKSWVDGCQLNNKKANAIKCFPLIDAIDPRQAYEFYWEFYEALEAKIAEPVLHMDMQDLNDDEKLHELFTFLGIPGADMVYAEKRQYWTTEEVTAIRKEMGRGKFV